MANFTSGPWMIRAEDDSCPHDEGGICIDKGEQNLVTVWGEDDETKATAHLVEAAPELYEAVKALYKDSIGRRRDATDVNWEVEKQVQAAIAKAEAH